jgi:heat shock protein HslJ
MIKRIALLALPLLAGCATMGNAAPSLAGSKWTFVSIDGQKPVSGKAWLNIDTDRIGATVGCNGMGGSVKIEPGRLITGPFMSTQMYCEGLMEQESAVSQLLSGSPRYSVKNDRLVLTGAGHRAELKRTN